MFYVKNRCLHAAINMTLFESFFGEKPDIGHLRLFGCSPYVLSEHGKKLDAKATKGIMLSYSDHSKTYLIGYPSDQTDVLRTYNSRNVTFDEVTPFLHTTKGKDRGSETTIIQVQGTAEGCLMTPITLSRQNRRCRRRAGDDNSSRRGT